MKATLQIQGYIDFQKLVKSAQFVITESGGLQEETTWLGVPCLTLRNNTERPVTVEKGTNRIVGSDLGKAGEAVDKILLGNAAKGEKPYLVSVHKVPFTTLRLPENSSFTRVNCVFSGFASPRSYRGRHCNWHFLNRHMTRSKLCLIYRRALLMGQKISHAGGTDHFRRFV